MSRAAKHVEGFSGFHEGAFVGIARTTDDDEEEQYYDVDEEEHNEKNKEEEDEDLHEKDERDASAAKLSNASSRNRIEKPNTLRILCYWPR